MPDKPQRPDCGCLHTPGMIENDAGLFACTECGRRFVCPNGCLSANDQDVEQKQKAPITSLKVIHVLCILCGAKSEQKCDTAQGDKDDDQHMIRQLDARRCVDLLMGRLLVDGTRVGL